MSVAIATAEARPAWTRVVPRCADYLDFMMRWQAGQFDDPPARPSDAMSPHWHAKLHPDGYLRGTDGKPARCQGLVELQAAPRGARAGGPVTMLGVLGEGFVIRRYRGLPRYECCFCRRRWKIKRRSRRPKLCPQCGRKEFFLISET